MDGRVNMMQIIQTNWQHDGPLYLQKGFGGFGYNEYIRKDGRVYIGRGSYQGAHCKNYNAVSYGICVEGNYDEEKQMPPAQKESLKARIQNALSEYPKIRSVHRHADFRATRCPGRYFPFEEFADMPKERDISFRSDEQILSAITLLSEKEIIRDAGYWERSAIKGQTVRGEYAGLLICRASDYIKKISEHE